MPITSNRPTKATQAVTLLRAYRTAGRKGLMADEARDAAGLSPRSCYWKRVSELLKRGYIERTGTKRTAESGSQQAVSRITTEGRAFLASLK